MSKEATVRKQIPHIYLKGDILILCLQLDSAGTKWQRKTFFTCLSVFLSLGQVVKCQKTNYWSLN